jgi:hypothetical protein
MAEIDFEIEEYDEAGTLVATYINSTVKTPAAGEDTTRIDVIVRLHPPLFNLSALD